MAIPETHTTLFTTQEPGQLRPEQVADELAIRRVIAANEQAINDNDVQTYMQTFAPDARAKYWDGEISGREAIGEYFRGTQKREVVRDWLIGLVISIDGDTATVVGTGTTIRAQQVPSQLLATTTIITHLKRDNAGVWRISYQEKRADPSFDPRVGTLADVVERLTKRIESLETNAQTVERTTGQKIAQEQVIAMEARLQQAVLTQDAASLNGLLADDFHGVGYMGAIVDKTQYIALHTNPDDRFTHFTTEHDAIQIFTDLALIRGVQDVTARIHLHSHYIGLFALRQAEWKVIYWQETGIVDPALFEKLQG